MDIPPASFVILTLFFQKTRNQLCHLLPCKIKIKYSRTQFQRRNNGILVGGRNSDHHIWNLIRKDFAKHYQVIVYDQRGTGQSDKPEQPPYSTRGFAQDAIVILDYLQIQRAHVYGVSIGGAIGQ